MRSSLQEDNHMDNDKWHLGKVTGQVSRKIPQSLTRELAIVMKLSLNMFT